MQLTCRKKRAPELVDETSCNASFFKLFKFLILDKDALDAKYNFMVSCSFAKLL